MATDEQIEILRGPLAGGVPPSALAAYGRWWQLETYLREVAYTELRAAFGASWRDHLGEAATTRAERDQINAYMASADADEPLAYADTSVLFALIKSKWELFEPVLLPQVRWEGLVDELLSIRNRSAHCRRPHRDDLARLEQSLRNLEPGAREFYRSYTQAQRLRPGEGDPLVDAWLDKSHPSAQRLVDHCQEQYDVSFRLSISTRPWGPSIEGVQPITGTTGVLWHADWILGMEEIRPSDLWKELNEGVRELLVHLLIDGSAVTATFAAIDDPNAVADAIGHVFDAIIVASRRFKALDPQEPAKDWFDFLRSDAETLPAKVQSGSALALFDPYQPEAFTIFAA
jgi:hypothetical protein